MQEFLFKNKDKENSNLLNIAQNAQSVHATETTKQMQFYIKRLINNLPQYSNDELINKVNNLEKEFLNLSIDIKNNTELLSLSTSEKADLLKPILDSLSNDINRANNIENRML